MPRYSKTEVAESLARLRKLCPPGTKVYTVNRHTSRSGMMRHISLFVSKRDGMHSISWDAARVLGYSLNDGRAHWALKVGGCGMDMGFHVVHSLSYRLHGHDNKGPKATEAGVRGHMFIPRRNEFRAGYSLTHEWI